MVPSWTSTADFEMSSEEADLVLKRVAATTTTTMILNPVRAKCEEVKCRQIVPLSLRKPAGKETASRDMAASPANNIGSVLNRVILATTVYQYNR
ncbi:hypothetical protein Tco_1295499 [Tanacetum coccineum]